MTRFKLIDKDTDISSLNIKPIGWDFVIKGKPFHVAHIKGYVHSIGGKWGDNDMWAYPRDEAPSYENLIEFHANEVVCWGLRYEENHYVKSKWDETDVRTASGTMITRNDEDFYFVPGSMDYSLAKARSIITKVNEGPFDVNIIDWDKQFNGKEITYKGFPAIIKYYIKKQGCVIAEYNGPEKYQNIVHHIWETESDSELSVKLDIIGYDHYDIDWFPEYAEMDDIKTYDELFDEYFDLKSEK